MPVLKDKAKRNELRREFYKTLEEEGMAIPAAVKTLRQILALDQEAFSKTVGISLSALRRIEQDKEMVRLDTLNKILKKYSLELRVGVKSR